MKAETTNTSGSENEVRGRRSTRSALSHYFAEIRQLAVLPAPAERELTRAVRDGRPGAFNELIEHNLRFVVKIALEYRDMGLPLEDLINEGNLGLIDAAHRFDPERGVKFTSWAVWWVRRSIRDALTNQAHLIRLPASQIRRMREMRAAEDTLTAELGRAPRNEELSERLPRNLAALDPIHQHGIRMTRLDEPANEDSRENLAASLEDERVESAEDAILRSEAAAQVREALEDLDAQQRTVIAERFGLTGGDTKTLAEIGDKIGRSSEGVRLIEQRAFKRLRRAYMTASRPRTAATARAAV